MTRIQWTDRQVENIVGNLLRAGVILSALIVFAGGVVFLARHGAQPTNYRVFRGEPAELRHLRGIIRGVLALHSRAIIQLGLLFLIATPIARVAFSIFGFAAEKDRLYMVFTSIVLLILLYSLVGSS